MVQTTSKTVKVNNVGEHCQMVLDDFFNFIEGRVEEVKIIDIRDIKDPVLPDKTRMRIMTARCNKAWLDYCDFVKLPRESRTLLINRIKKEWHLREKQHRSFQVKKRQSADS